MFQKTKKSTKGFLEECDEINTAVWPCLRGRPWNLAAFNWEQCLWPALHAIITSGGTTKSTFYGNGNYETERVGREDSPSSVARVDKSPESLSYRGNFLRRGGGGGGGRVGSFA